ncbi:hypothetical protein KPH14_011866 [Odynerus spinipes]|uniref:Uncharacterized protein n=1 Tax=Odynerus spinipes TaxID=1348599 RepID=A0AAD9VKB5_9HYME|nr:hypothetical protein KPH14_011866 [Odynerus spinipes]
MPIVFLRNWRTIRGEEKLLGSQLLGSRKMNKNDENIERWLQQEMSDEEAMPDEDCSDMEPDLAEDVVQIEDCDQCESTESIVT